MKCPSCGEEIGMLPVCPKCGREMKNSAILAGESMQKAGKSMSDVGCAMTMGCTVPIIILLVILFVFVF